MLLEVCSDQILMMDSCSSRKIMSKYIFFFSNFSIIPETMFLELLKKGSFHELSQKSSGKMQRGIENRRIFFFL